MATTKKAAAKKKAASLPLKSLTKSHAKELVNHVNGMLAAKGFSAQVSEMHFAPAAEDDSIGCDNCQPPSVCKRVCFINDQGVPECEDRCVAP